MKAITKIVFVSDEDEKFFGEGPCGLLREIERTGSLRQASMQMGMAYSKALNLVKNAEKALDVPLVARTTGGLKGGGSVLTKDGREWIERYETYRDACRKQNELLFEEVYCDQRKQQGHIKMYQNSQDPVGSQLGCVIMASGIGRRFGGNKLMADCGGKPVIGRVLDALSGFAARQIVVTRSVETAAYVRERNVPVLLHDLPDKSDTTRLGVMQMQDLKACLFCPADQPALKASTVRALLCAWEKEPDKIWRLAEDTYGKNAGAPVIFPAAYYEELMSLTGERGGGAVAMRHLDQVRYLAAESIIELKDVDTPQALYELINDQKTEGKEQ